MLPCSRRPAVVAVEDLKEKLLQSPGSEWSGANRPRRVEAVARAALDPRVGQIKGNIEGRTQAPYRLSAGGPDPGKECSRQDSMSAREPLPHTEIALLGRDPLARDRFEPHSLAVDREPRVGRDQQALGRAHSVLSDPADVSMSAVNAHALAQAASGTSVAEAAMKRARDAFARAREFLRATKSRRSLDSASAWS